MNIHSVGVQLLH